MSTLYDPRVHHRRAMRLQSWDYTWAWWYFVTICVQDRRAELGTVDEGAVKLSRFGEIARESWLWLAQHHEWVEVDEFVVMPNHLHGIIALPYKRAGRAVGATRRVAPTTLLEAGSLGSIMGQIKSVVTKRATTAGLWCLGSIWQRSFYDHIIRNEADLHRLRTYIRHNPLRWAFDEENPGSVAEGGGRG